MSWQVIVFFVVVVAFLVYTRLGRVSGTEARKLVAEGALLVDVRSPDEFAAGHLAGARNVPVSELSTRLDELGAKERSIIVYCRSGARSARAAGMLKRAGYSQVVNLGPMSAW